jgi:hypothetical protein
MMLAWLNVVQGGVKIVAAILMVAGAIEAGDSTICLIRGLASVVPVAWTIANRIVPDS